MKDYGLEDFEQMGQVVCRKRLLYLGATVKS